jgi:uncharacterized membrane protein
MLAITVLSLMGDVILKRPCVTGVWIGRFEYNHLCYNDLQPLYYARGLDEGKVPYVEAFGEYPTLTGTEMYIAAALSASDRSFFVWNALVLGVCALLTTSALGAMTKWRWRVLLFAAAPSLILYANHNWDLLAVAPLACGLWLWTRGRFGWSGAMLGLGAAAKLFPGAALVTGVVALLRDGRKRTAALFGASVLGVVAAWNLPYAVANRTGWWKTWSFHAGRFPDFGTVWYWLWNAAHRPNMLGYRHLSDRLGLFALVAATVAVGILQLRRRLPMPQATGIVLAAFLVVAKVHSPQYALWMLPFLVIVPRSWPVFALYEAADLLVYVSGFRWIAQWSADLMPVPSGWRTLFVVGVFARAGALVVMAVHFVRSAGSPSEALDGRGGHDALADLAKADRFAVRG